MGEAEESESDAALWLEATSGTERAFVAIFDRYRVRVFRAAYRRMGNIADAEEAVAIVFLEVWRLRKRVRIVDGSLLPWLLSVTGNVSFNLTRSRRRYARMLAQLPPPGHQEDHTEQVDDFLDGRYRRSEIRKILATLSPGDRAVVEMVFIEELSLSTVAATLNVPVGTVKSRLHRARKQLQAALRGADMFHEHPISPLGGQERGTA